MKSKNFIISYQIYPFDLMVSFCETDEQFFKALKKRLPEDNYSEIKEAGLENIGQGRSGMFSCGASYIRLRNYPNTNEAKGFLSHEIFHAVHFLMDRIKMPLSDDSREAYAYAIGYLTTEIYKKL